MDILLVIVLCWNFLAGSVSGGAPPKAEESPWLHKEVVETVVEELIHHFKADASSRKSEFTQRLVKRIYAYQDDLRPIYNSLPKNEKGHLEVAEVGQALHRLFVRRYQMHLRGLASFGDSSDGEAPATKVEEFVQKAIQSGLVDKGFTNRELSIFAVAMEHLIHEETRGILTQVFSMFSLPQGTAIGREEARQALDAYAVFLLARQDIRFAYEINKDVLARSTQRLGIEQSDLLDLCRKQLYTQLASQADDGLTFDALLVIAEEFEQGLGATHQEAVCEARKKVVLSADVACDSSGRIPLSALRSNSFVGSSEALNHQGILETSSDSEQMAYFANWMLSADNCEIKTDFYTVCCADPCEMMLSKIEQQLNTPFLKMEHVDSVVPLLSGANSKTQAELRSFLTESIGVAGNVDIHGTSFAEFLHYSVPCQCPHVTKNQSHPLPSSTTLAVRQSEQAQSEESPREQQQPPAQQKTSALVVEESVVDRSFGRYATYVLILLLLSFGLWFALVQRSAFYTEYGKPRKVDYKSDMKCIV